MNEHLIELNKRMHSLNTIESRNAPFSTAEKMREDQIKSLQDSDIFKDLPNFCQHLPFEMKLALLSLNKLHNTPHEFGVSALLGFANTSCQHLYNVESYKYGPVPISLFIMVLLGTGGSKSTIYRELKEPIISHQKTMRHALETEEGRFVQETKKRKELIKKYEEDREQGFSAQFPDSVKPIETANYFNDKGTVNGIIDILKSQAHMSLVSAEAGVFFSSHAFQGAKADNSRAVEMIGTLTKLWDGDTVSRNIKEEIINLDNRRVNMLFLVQKEVIKDVLSNKTFNEQGFIPRLLIADIQPFDKPKMSFDPEDMRQEEIARQRLEPYLQRLRDIISQKPKLVADRNFELDPVNIASDHDAKILLAQFYNHTLNISTENNRLEHYHGFANRLHEHAIRIAATIAVFNRHQVIKLEDAQCAIDLMHMFIDHRYNLEFGAVNMNPDLTQNAATLFRFFQKRQDEKFTRRELMRSTSLRELDSEYFKKVLIDLLDKHLIERSEVVVGGKVKEHYGYKKKESVTDV